MLYYAFVHCTYIYTYIYICINVYNPILQISSTHFVSLGQLQTQCVSDAQVTPDKDAHGPASLAEQV